MAFASGSSGLTFTGAGTVSGTVAGLAEGELTDEVVTTAGVNAFDIDGVEVCTGDEMTSADACGVGLVLPGDGTGTVARCDVKPVKPPAVFGDEAGTTEAECLGRSGAPVGVGVLVDGLVAEPVVGEPLWELLEPSLPVGVEPPVWPVSA